MTHRINAHRRSFLGLGLGLNPFGPEFFELAKQGGAEFPMDEVSKTRVAPRAEL